MVMITDAHPPCPGELRVSPVDKVPCLLPVNHTQHSHPDGTDNPNPTYHQGVWNGRVYAWSERDASTIRTLRNAGFHAQCDHHAVKLAVVVTP